MNLFSLDDEVKALRARITASLDLFDLLVRDVREEVAGIKRAREAAGVMPGFYSPGLSTEKSDAND